MKTTHTMLLTTAFALVVFIPALPASALSCLPVSDYLETVINDDNIQIFTGTTKTTVTGTGYTAEQLTVSEAHQGYVENTLFAYHQKDDTWGYLCNSGPKADGATSIYITERDAYGKYNVYQRLDVTDEVVKTLLTDLKEADVTGEVSDITATDRRNQIMTSIQDLLREIGILLKEYALWSSV
jgi:hypothetical protein